MQFLSNSLLKSVVAAAAALMVLAIPAQADPYDYCSEPCLQAAAQAQQAAEASAAAAVQNTCSQTTQTSTDFYACMTSGQQSIQNAGQAAYNNTLSQCQQSCWASHY